MRKDEEHCKTAFDTFLKQRYRPRDIIWISGDSNKPPDFFLYLGGEKYAVEVTSVLEKAKIGNTVIDHIEIDRSIKTFIDDIKKDAVEKEILQGAYIVRYNPIDDFGKQKHVIAMRIMDYLRQTRNMSSATKEDIIGEGHLGWYIYKLHSDKNYISQTTGDARFKGEAENELCNLLNEALETKARKLKTVSLPKILLLYDRFAWINGDTWQQYASKLSCVSDFHTIFIVSDKSNNSILYTIESSWLNQI